MYILIKISYMNEQVAVLEYYRFCSWYKNKNKNNTLKPASLTRKELLNSHLMEYYTVMRMNVLLLYTLTWLNLKILYWIKYYSHSKKIISSIVPFIEKNLSIFFFSLEEFRTMVSSLGERGG